MAQKPKSEPSEVLIVNDVPGEECRVAILQDGHLEELYSEKTATATNVGNIYLGRVTNVESAIQAAFIDFGEGQNGFLHVSDLHPRHFPGDEQTERVGHKIPRKSRPAIQECLKRGQQILVQVLKEGIGTKGPTLTSYLSIPGRLLVAMPFMDKVGVSRRVEDDEQRREMRKVLDQLELPDGFGFILRTAGLGRTKTDLKRDVAYLMRLWKTMEKRHKGEKAPCELYRESDLLIRTIRDVLRPSIHAIVIDSKDGYERARHFVRVIAPRSAPKVIRYARPTPIFHAFDIERQIDLIHSREVPLPSGGSIVIEQTEALVAIDVNSGKSLKARDSETNAYETNREAVDEICRQLRLRDLGGLIINDLIDMRPTRNRRKIEDRVRENLKRDRAKSTALKISEFGILEMTRQRMRPSLRKAHFVTCPNCNGHGEIMSAESVATNAVRHAGYLLQYQRIEKLEVVCSPRVASVMLSSKRRQLVQLEDDTGRTVEVRVSDAIATDRVDFYAYDDRGADVDISRLTPLKLPTMKELEQDPENEIDDPPIDVEADIDIEMEEDDSDSKPATKKRRRRSRSKKPQADGPAASEASAEAEAQTEKDAAESEHPSDGDATDDAPPKKRRRRGRRGGRRRSKKRQEQAAAEEQQTAADPQAEEQQHVESREGGGESMRVHALAKELGVASREVIERASGDESITLKNHMSSVPPEHVTVIRGWFNDSVMTAASQNEKQVDESAADDEKGSGKRRRRSRRRSKRGSGAGDGSSDPQAAADTAPDDTKAPPDDAGSPRKKRRRRSSNRASEQTSETGDKQPAHENRDDADAESRKKTRRRKKKVDAKSDGREDASTDDGSGDSDGSSDPKQKRRRSVYASRRRVSPARVMAEQQDS